MDEPSRDMIIAMITGKAYSTQAQQRMSSPRTLRCPHPKLHDLISSMNAMQEGQKQCGYVFTRAYDLRRHLCAEHNQEVGKDTVDTWVRLARNAKIASLV